MRVHLLRAAMAALVLCAGPAHAIGTFVLAPPRADVAYDDRRDIMYITAGTQVLRYRVGDATFLTPVALGGTLHGIDLSPDGNAIAVADTSHSEDSSWIHIVDLDRLVSRRLEAPLGHYLEAGTWSVAWSGPDSVVASSQSHGSALTRLRRFDVTSGESAMIAEVWRETMLSASGDRSVIAFAEGNISTGEWGVYRTATGEFVRRGGYEDGTASFNFEAATNHDGSQVAIPTEAGEYIYDDTHQRIAVLGVASGARPVGGAYDPVDALAYFPWSGSSEVRVYDMEQLEEVGRYDIDNAFDIRPDYIQRAYVEGRTKLSADGSLLMVTVEGGVRILRMFAPLRAESWTQRVGSTARHRMPLRGSIGNGGALRYEILRKPVHGVLTLNRGIATYGWTSRRANNDRFVYRVHYGRAWADAVVTIVR